MSIFSISFSPLSRRYRKLCITLRTGNAKCYIRGSWYMKFLSEFFIFFSSFRCNVRPPLVICHNFSIICFKSTSFTNIFHTIISMDIYEDEPPVMHNNFWWTWRGFNPRLALMLNNTLYRLKIELTVGTIITYACFQFSIELS